MSLQVRASTIEDDDSVFLGVHCVASVSGPHSRPRPYHLALLLDTSGSMEEYGRMNAVKQTLHILVDVMKPDDRLTIITYESTATILANAHALTEEGKAALHVMIDAIVPEGSTNLESACIALETITVAIDSVFILTDGHVNRGLQDPRALQDCIYGHVARGTPIHTLGYGTDHNARLLRDIAVGSRGSYTYAERDELLSGIIGTICGGLEHQIGRNVCLKGLTPPDWTCMELAYTAGATSYTVGPLTAEKPVWIMLQGKRGAPIPSLSLTWTNTRTHEDERVDVRIDSSIHALELTKQRDRAHVAQTLVRITECIDNGDITGASACADACCVYLDRSEAKHTEFVKGLYAQIQDICEEIERQRMAPPQLRRGSMMLPTQSPSMCRMISNTTVLATQQGGAVDDPMTRVFLSPAERHTSNRMRQMFAAASASVSTNMAYQAAATTNPRPLTY